MEISVNCPSYKRADCVKTLAYLPYCRVWVDEHEAGEYKKNYPDADIVACPHGVQGNVSRVRNYILDREFDRGADVVVIVDDDLHYMERFELKDGFGYARHKLDADEFLVFVEKYSIMAEDIGAKFWGVNVNLDNRCFRHFTPFSTMAFVGGPFQAFLRGNKCRYDETLPLKEDYDMTLQQLNKERVVLRVNAYHYACEQSENKGGCAAYRNIEKEMQQLESLRIKWGGRIVKYGQTKIMHGEKVRGFDDYNPVIKPPIKGV